MLLRSLFFGLIFLLSGCSMLSPVKVDPINKYMINTVPCVHKTHSHPVSLLVLPPETGPLYNTPEMAYSLYPYQVDYFVKNQWAAQPTQMLHPLIVQTLQNTQFFSVVTGVGSSKHDYVLATQLLELRHIFRRCDSYIKLKVRAQLIDNDTNDVFGVRQFCITEKAPCCTPYGGVIAANRATGRMLASMAPFVIHGVLIDQETV